MDKKEVTDLEESAEGLEDPKGNTKEAAAAGDTEIETGRMDQRKHPELTVPRSGELTGTIFCVMPSRPRSPMASQPKCPSVGECFQNVKVQMNPLPISSSEKDQQFIQNYKKKYGEPSLDFYVGDLKSAYKVSCNQPADEKKLLAIYLHHGGSILTNNLCQQVLKNDEVLTTFNNLFIVYGCDMSNTTDASFFHDQLRDIISVEAAEAAKNLKLDQMPAFLIIGKSTDGGLPNIAVIYGDNDDDTLQTLLQLQYSLLSGLYD